MYRLCYLLLVYSIMDVCVSGVLYCIVLLVMYICVCKYCIDVCVCPHLCWQDCGCYVCTTSVAFCHLIMCSEINNVQ